MYIELKQYLDMTYEEFFTNIFLRKNNNLEANNKVEYFSDYINNLKLRESEKIELYLYDENQKKQKYLELDKYINKIKIIAENYIKFYKS